jgi:hypothetical protein
VYWKRLGHLTFFTRQILTKQADEADARAAALLHGTGSSNVQKASQEKQQSKVRELKY